MRFDTVCTKLIKLLQNQECFSGTDIVGAYPKAVNPTLSAKPVICIGFSDAEAHPSGIGEERMAGAYCIFADIFVSYNIRNDYNIKEIFSNICMSFEGLNIISVKSQGTAYDKDTHSYVFKSVFTFADSIDFGGDADE